MGYRRATSSAHFPDIHGYHCTPAAGAQADESNKKPLGIHRFSPRTVQAYTSWILDYIRNCSVPDSAESTEPEGRAFLACWRRSAGHGTRQDVGGERVAL